MRSTVVVLLTLLALVTAASCKKAVPKVGDACKTEGASVCTDPKTRLKCVDGKYWLEHCDQCVMESKSGFGTKSSTESFINCGQGGDGPEGSPCLEGTVDCADPKTEVICEDKKYKHYPCKGAKGCTRAGTTISCDFDVSAVGDACRPKNIACTADNKTMLRCRDGKFAAELACTGPKGCYDAKDSLHCDAPTANVGEPCAGGEGACSTDHKDLVSCQDGKFAVMKRCRGKDPRCASVEESSNCVDPGVVQLGDPCAPDTGGCSADGRSFMKCKDGTLVLEHACRSCKMNDPEPGRVTCHY